MVIINETQERLLAAVARAKTAYDRQVGQLEEQLQELRAQSKEPIRVAVRAAKEAGVPDRQIHLRGLGMAQYGQMVNFLKTPAAKRAQSEEFERDLFGVHTLITPPANQGADWEFSGLDASGKVWEAVDPDGNVYGIVILSAGKIAMMKPNKDKPGEYSDWTPELIRQAKIHNPKWITQEEFKAIQAQDDEEDE